MSARRTEPPRLLDPGPDPWFDCSRCGFVFDTVVYGCCPSCVAETRSAAPGQWPGLDPGADDLLGVDVGNIH